MMTRPLLVFLSFAAGITAAAASTPTMTSQTRNQQQQQQHPVLLVPGDGGSQLQAKLHKSSHRPHFYCQKSTASFETLWLAVTSLLPGEIECWVDNIQLVWNSTSLRFDLNQEIDYRVVPGLKAVESLDPSLPSKTVYLGTLVDNLVRGAAGGLVKGKSLRAAPYDFRRLPSAEWLAATRQTVEEMFAQAGGQPVVLVAHSMGNVFVEYLLAAQTPAWRAKYVHHYVAVSAPFGGCLEEVQVLLAGDNEGIPLVSPLTVRPEQRSYETNYLLMPVPQVFGLQAFLDLDYTKEQFTAANFSTALGRAYAPGAQFYHARSADWIPKMVADPGVPTTLVYGQGVKTLQMVRYASASDFPDSPTFSYNTDGDGTVQGVSLRSPTSLKWKSLAGPPVVVEGASHVGVLSTSNLTDAILKVSAA